MSKALVVFSGGQDSTTCLAWAIEKYGKENVTALTFDYGQKHIDEVNCSIDVVAELGVGQHIMDVRWLGELSKSALTSDDIEVTEAGDYDGELPPTFVPGRNHIFLSVAAIYAYHNGMDVLVTGVCETDFSGYPDCRNDFVESLQQTLNLAMATNISIETPLMYLDKSQVWELSDELGVMELVRTRTLTCYNGIPGDGCGHCDSCNLRKKGYDTYLERRGNGNGN